jgi:hypothetical protein
LIGLFRAGEIRAPQKALFHAGFSDQSPCYSPDNVHAHFAASREAVEPLSRFAFTRFFENENALFLPLIPANYPNTRLKIVSTCLR